MRRMAEATRELGRKMREATVPMVAAMHGHKWSNAKHACVRCGLTAEEIMRMPAAVVPHGADSVVCKPPGTPSVGSLEIVAEAA